MNEDFFDRKIKIGNNEVSLDENKLKFNEATLTKYFEEEALHYDYYGRMLADAEYLLQRNELQYDVVSSEKFKMFKEAGGSDALCNAKVTSDEEVVEAKKLVLAAKRKVMLLKQHLRAWDKAHENALNLGYTLRREMSKLNSSISYDDDAVNRIVGGGN